MHSYLHNIKTFNNATRHLTRVERVLYRDLIELYYDTEQPLPANDFDRLARRVEATSDDDKTALRYVLSEFFELTGDVYTHQFCDEQIDSYHAMSNRKSLAGKASAEARAKKAAERKAKRSGRIEQESTGDEQVLSKCSTNHEPLTMNHEPLTNNKKAAPAKRFAKPTVDEITAYCMERRKAGHVNTVDPQRFFDYYEANGWRVGKNPMKNWKAAITATWEKNSYGNNRPQQSVGRLSLAERSEQESREILADIEAREIYQRTVGANESVVSPQVGQGRGAKEGRGEELHGELFAVVQED